MTTYPYIPADPSHTGGAQTAISRIVIHGTVSPCVKGGAGNVARYFQTKTAGGAAHYVVDPGVVVCCVHEGTVAYHAPPNMDSLGVELCDPQSGDTARWGDPSHVAMLGLAAKLVADLCHRHSVPVVYVNAANLLAGAHGITAHADVSQAWHQSSHTDPGVGFPMARFIDLVRAAAQPAPTPSPAPTPILTEETDMRILRTVDNSRPLVLLKGDGKVLAISNAKREALLRAGVPEAKISAADYDVIAS